MGCRRRSRSAWPWAPSLPSRPSPPRVAAAAEAGLATPPRPRRRSARSGGRGESISGGAESIAWRLDAGNACAAQTSRAQQSRRLPSTPAGNRPRPHACSSRASYGLGERPRHPDHLHTAQASTSASGSKPKPTPGLGMSRSRSTSTSPTNRRRAIERPARRGPLRLRADARGRRHGDRFRSRTTTSSRRPVALKLLAETLGRDPELRPGSCARRGSRPALPPERRARSTTRARRTAGRSS